MATSMVTLILALKKLDWRIEKGFHNLTGFIVDLAVLLLAAGGVVAYRLQTTLKWSTKTIR